jgi:transposase-like protein
MEYPKCKSEESVKNSFAKEMQRYKCTKCKYQYTRNTKEGEAKILNYWWLGCMHMDPPLIV